MTMSRHAAYAGEHARHDDVLFTVTFYSAPELAAVNGKTPRGHHRYRKAGWYWCRRGDAAPGVGAFTSSHKAYVDAMAWKAKP